MLRQRTANLVNRCLWLKILPAEEVQTPLSAQVGLGSLSQEATQLRALSNWLTSSWQSQSAYFSSGQQMWAKAAGGSTPGEEEAAARGAADDSEQAAAAAAAAAAEEAGGVATEEFQELPPEQPHQAARDKSEASHATELAEDLADKLKRTLADMENLRQRSARQAENTQKFAIQGFLKSMLDVGDNLERAHGAVPPAALQGKDEAGQDLNSQQLVSLLNGIVNGIRLTENIFDQGLRQNGVEKYRPQGEKFDPNLHEALFEIPDPNQEPGTVGAVTKTGYTLHGRVVRPAQVGVVRAP